METKAIHDELSEACRTGNIEQIKCILSHDPSLLNFQDNDIGWTPLCRSVIYDHLEAVQFLLQSGADPNIQDLNKNSVLHQSIENCQVKFVKLLLGYKVDLNLAQKGTFYLDGDSALHLAVIKENFKIIDLLLKSNCDVDIKNSFTGQTPLHYAVEIPNTEIVKKLLESNANPRIRDNSNKSPLDLSTSNKTRALMQTYFKDNNISTKNTHLITTVLKETEEIPEIPFLIESIPTINPTSPANPHTDVHHNFTTAFEDQDFDRAEPPRSSLAFSFGAITCSLHKWLESVGLEFLYENLVNGGYDDLDQILIHMRSSMPITEELLFCAGIKKPGHRKRLLAALHEEIRPLKVQKARPRHNQSSSLHCCIVPALNNPGVIMTSDLNEWLVSIDLGFYYKNFVEAGYESLEHMLALMNSGWSIEENTLKYEVKIPKQAHRYKILARLKTDSQGFETMKTGGQTIRLNTIFDKNVNSVACGYCMII